VGNKTPPKRTSVKKLKQGLVGGKQQTMHTGRRGGSRLKGVVQLMGRRKKYDRRKGRVDKKLYLEKSFCL